ncbi:hypothetical protein T484DRAFT_2637667 [Baffinella frigidus]|nr:hypothetical protein T484DRAFT_2637667 [Cryptophyta sp. CCMP2293]
MSSAAVILHRDEQAGSERGARWWKPQSAAGMMVLAVVVLLGVVDGGVRAHFGVGTILGEELSMTWGEDHGPATMSTDASTMFPAVGSSRHLLMQVFEGSDCEVSYNCVSGLVCREGVCSVCGSDAECEVRNKKEKAPVLLVLLVLMYLNFRSSRNYFELLR